MVSRTKKIISTILMLVLLAASLPVQRVKAAEKWLIYYQANGEKGQYGYCIDDGFAACYKTGGIIRICKDVELDFPDFIQYGCLTKETKLVIDSDATVTIGKNGFRMDGLTQVLGTIDMEHSEGILYGDGKLEFLSGKLIKRSYDVDQKGEEVCLEGKDISYGQTLADAEIKQDKINWRASVEGSWRFLEPEQKPQAGTRKHDVIFEPKYPMTYESKVFERCGKVTTRQAVPQLHSYEPLEIHIGETLQNVKPDIHYIDPANGEEVTGNFSFDQTAQTLLSVGEQQLRGSFIPDDDNYAIIEEYLNVYVQMTDPKVTKDPMVRNQGTYGETLGQIHFVPGKCVNPYNDNEVTGTWEWKDSTERLELGTKTYTMLFLPDLQGYETKEIPLEVTTNPKVMEDIEWPSCTDINYGQRLSDSELSFVKNEYGTFSWQNDNLRLDVKNQGATVVFRPANTNVYDWSRLSGYDEESNTVSFVIPVRVCPLKGELPVIEAEEVEENSSVSGSALRISGMAGEVVWQQPEQRVEQSGWVPVYFIPEDSDNYDWSSYAPDEQGKISVDVYVKVLKKPEPTGEPGTVTTPEPTEEPLKEKDENHVTSQSPPDTLDDTVKHEEIQTESSPLGDTPSFVITQMVSKMSKIRTPSVVVNKTAWLERKRKNGRMVLRWKKVKGVRYQIQYGIDKKWKKSKKKIVRGTSVTIRGLKRRQKYYVRIRCLKTKNGKTYYSKWSKRKQV